MDGAACVRLSHLFACLFICALPRRLRGFSLSLSLSRVDFEKRFQRRLAGIRAARLRRRIP